MIVEKISAPVASDFPDEWYDLSKTDHFWLAWRLRVLERLLSDHGIARDVALRILDIGCGRGLLRTQLENRSRWVIDGADLNQPALDQVSPARGRTMLYDIHERLPSLQNAFDGILLLDVLEHIADDRLFFADAVSHLRLGGWALINVPASPILYSKYDTLVGHFRRYDQRSLTEALIEAVPDFEILEMRYWGFSLLPLAALRKVMIRSTRTPQEAVGRGFDPPAKWMNTALRRLMALETSWLKRPLYGTSLMVLGRKARA